MADIGIRGNRETAAEDGRKRRAMRGIALAVGLGAMIAVGACTPRVDVRGNVADKEDMIRIRQGITTAAEVRRVLGSPSTVSAFDNKTWYYVSKREEALAFFKPTTTQHQVIELRFDEAEVVQRIRTYSLKDARSVSRVSRVTKSDGGEPGVFRSLVDMIVRRGSVVRKSKNKFGL